MIKKIIASLVAIMIIIAVGVYVAKTLNHPKDIVIPPVQNVVSSDTQTAGTKNEEAPTAPISTGPVEKFSVSGTYVCLPHKNTEGPQTMECALGLKTDKGLYYAVDMTDAKPPVLDIGTGQKISVVGMMVPQNNLNSNHWQIYPIEGIIKVNTWTKK